MVRYGGIRAGAERKRENIMEIGEWGGGTAVKLEGKKHRQKQNRDRTENPTQSGGEKSAI